MMNTNDLKSKLQERLLALRARVGAVNRDLRAAHDRDWTERAIEIENDDVLERLEPLTRAEIRALQDALQRIETGKYGTCVRCGRPIGRKRLDAEPTTTTCVSCAAETGRSAARLVTLR
jgi:RNA polymerase-binding transcription factor DksA